MSADLISGNGAILLESGHPNRELRNGLPFARKNSLSTKIWILDHHYNLWGRAICTLDDPGVSRYVDGVAWHGYAGKEEMMRRASRQTHVLDRGRTGLHGAWLF